MQHTNKSLVRSLGTIAILCVAIGGAAVAKEGFSDKVTTLKDGLKEMLQKEGATKLAKATFAPTAAQAASINKQCGITVSGTFTMYKGLKADDSLMGTVMIIDQEGKEGPLQLLIALKPDGTVYDAAYTVFGEERGKPALSWGFLKQYVGKNASSPLTIGKDVDQVSGATTTSKSVTTAFKKAVCVYAEAKKSGI